MTVYNELIYQLSLAGIPSPRLEARLMLAHVLNEDSNSTIVMTAKLSPKQDVQLKEMVILRTEKHFPLDKILGIKAFYKYEFVVNEDVLSPRPDTEILLEEALRLMNEEQGSILDLGTGSGCILLSLLKEKINYTGVGVDVSEKALLVAQKNAQHLQVENRVTWLNANWFDDNFLTEFPKPFNIIVSNPPYISEAEIKNLASEVKDHDPYQALSGGSDGLESYRKIAELTPFLLGKGGYILLECGKGQTQAVAEIFSEHGLSLCNIIKDLSGYDRCVILKK